MKKILVLSDSHGHFDKVLKIYEIENPDIVIYTGDGLRDIEELSYIYNSEFYIVNGNCDFFEKNYGLTKILNIENVKIFITHGHLYGVKTNLNNLKNMVQEVDARVGIFGHTHKEILENFDNFYLFNPGAAENGKYGIIYIKDEEIQFFHKRI